MIQHPQVIISCEHAGNRVPTKYRDLFQGPHAIRCLKSHLGWDPGAAEGAFLLSHSLDCESHKNTCTRLLVDVNRSPESPTLLSQFTRGLDQKTTAEIIARYYQPYRCSLGNSINGKIQQGIPIIHLSIHTFTPLYCGQRRRFDIGFLFDPSRIAESRLCMKWGAALQKARPRCRVRFNQPYLGIDDGLTTTNRRRFQPNEYIGVEVEVNNHIHCRSENHRKHFWRDIAESVIPLVQAWPAKN